MEINRSNILDIINKADLKPDKDYGQNFLIDQEISEKIVDLLGVKKEDNVLEIGPGLGSLTHFLASSKGFITAVDIDRRMIDFLKIVYKENNNIEIVENDIRKTKVEKFNKIVGNLPYNITTETIQYLLLNASKAAKMVFMIQSENFPHFFDTKGKEYGPTSILIHLLGKIEKAFVVKPGSFYPSPKCGSTVFAIILNQDADKFDSIKAFKIAKQLFLNRRKTILNNLNNYLKNKDLSINLCHDLGISPLSRPEDLSPEVYLSIARYLK